jgi:hypothetical protein
MVQSALINKKLQLETEIKRGVRDPKRRQYLINRLLQIESILSAMGFSPEDVERNDFAFAGSGGANNRGVTSDAHLVSLPSWMKEDAPKQDQKQQTEDNLTNFERVKSYRDEMYARHNAFEKK